MDHQNDDPRQPRVMGGGFTQLDFGSGNLIIDGIHIARYYVSQGDVDGYVIEDIVVHDKAKFLDPTGTSVKFVYEGHYGVSFACADVELISRAEQSSPAVDTWRAAIVGKPIEAKDLPTPDPNLSVTEYHLKDGSGTVQGYLFRRPTTTSHGEPCVEEYWVMREGYERPAENKPVTVHKLTTTVDLKTRLVALRTEANGTGTNPPASYLPASYRLHEYPSFN